MTPPSILPPTAARVAAIGIVVGIRPVAIGLVLWLAG